MARATGRSDTPEPPDEALARYAQMRDFERTPEPPPGDVARRGPLTFTIQKHAARRLHYDLRLEMHGVLASWPIPRGPSYDAAERRLAVHTEDHPYDYGTWEGVIPGGAYGAGQVIVWDAGTYTILEEGRPPDFRDRARSERLAEEGAANGHLRIFFNGRKLKGGWTLLRTRDRQRREQWLFMKRRDGLEDARREVTAEDRSIFSGLRLEDLQAGTRLSTVRYKSLRPTARGVPGARRMRMPAPYEPAHAARSAVAFCSRRRVVWRGALAAPDRLDELTRALARQPFDQAIVEFSLPDGVPCDLHYLDGYDLTEVAAAERTALLYAVLAPLPGIAEPAPNFC